MESLQDYGQEYKNTEIMLVQVCLEELQEYLAHTNPKPWWIPNDLQYLDQPLLCNRSLMSEYVSRKNFWLTCIPDFAGKLQCVCANM